MTDAAATGGISRRSMLASLAAAGLSACIGDPLPPGGPGARLYAQPGTPGLIGATGLTTFGVLRSRVDVYVPASVQTSAPAGLLVFLHGAGRQIDLHMEAHMAGADANGVIVLMPMSTGFTWDAIDGGFGPDPYMLDLALQWVFDRWTISPLRLAISGFGDGATYALGLGRANGDLFTQMVAYSAGFVMPVQAVPPKRPILLTHGVNDSHFPIDLSGRVVASQLGQLAYPLDYREFLIPHQVPQTVVDEVLLSLA